MATAYHLDMRGNSLCAHMHTESGRTICADARVHSCSYSTLKAARAAMRRINALPGRAGAASVREGYCHAFQCPVDAASAHAVVTAQGERTIFWAPASEPEPFPLAVSEARFRAVDQGAPWQATLDAFSAAYDGRAPTDTDADVIARALATLAAQGDLPSTPAPLPPALEDSARNLLHLGAPSLATWDAFDKAQAERGADDTDATVIVRAYDDLRAQNVLPGERRKPRPLAWSRMIAVRLAHEPDETACTMREFADANADAISAAEIMAIRRALAEDGAWRAPEYSLRLTVPRR